MTPSEARPENNVNLDFPRLAGQSGPVPVPMGLHKGLQVVDLGLLLGTEVFVYPSTVYFPGTL